MLGKDKSAVLRHIDYLENNQWLCRNDDMNDRRRKILVLTKKGEIHLQKARLLEQKLTKTVLKNVNKDQTTKFMQTMDNILANIFELDENSQELKNI
jgi:DNA-binding MarR family transcriptional regulator